MHKSLHHSFDISLAETYGIEEAILIHHFQHWVAFNKRLKRNYHKGRTWSYQTLEEISAHFPYLTKDKIRDILIKLTTGKGRKSKIKSFEPVLMTGNFNKSSYDRTIWYAFVDEQELSNPQNDLRKCPNGKSEIPTPIPDTKQDTIKKESKPKKTVASATLASKDAHDISLLIENKYNDHRKSLGNTSVDLHTTKAWLKASASLLRKHTKAKIELVLEFAYKDDFWRGTVASPSGLLRNFYKLEDKLAVQMPNVKEGSARIEQIQDWLRLEIKKMKSQRYDQELKFNKTSVWDSKHNVKWDILDPLMRKNVEDFYRGKWLK